MPIFPVRADGPIYDIYQTYGDTQTGRRLATEYIISLYEFYYGIAYEYRLASGYYVADNGYVKLGKLIDDINAGVGGYCEGYSLYYGNGGLQVVKIKKENPRYIYPTYYEYRIAPYDTTDRFLFNPLGIQNHKYNGCKLSGIDVNIDSTETVDGGPVVKITRVNQNQIVFSNNNITTARSNTSGLPARQLTSRTTSGGSGTISNTTTNVVDNQE